MKSDHSFRTTQVPALRKALTWRLLFFFMALLELAFLHSAGGSTIFTNSTSYPVGATPVSVVVADFNGDGKQDLATANGASANISILLGNGDGSFRSPVTFAVGANPADLVAADFNADGKQDLAVSNYSSNNISVLLGDGKGSFTLVGSFPAFQTARLAVGDFNGDGAPDLVTASASQNRLPTLVVSLLLGDGHGAFGSANAIFTREFAGSASLAVTDFDRDGRQDLAVYYGDIALLPGNGNGSFGAPILSMVGGTVGSIAVGDFNRDNRIDLATSQSILLGDSKGGFGPPISFGSQQFFGSIAVADFDGNGSLDVAVAQTSSTNPFPEVVNGVGIFLGNNDGTMLLNSTTLTGKGADSLAVGDFNRDGKPDLAVSNYYDNTVSILLNTRTPPNWQAIDLAVGSDNKARILWTKSSGEAAVWSVDNAGQPGYGPIYGPFPGYIASHIAAGADGLTRVLWNRADGTAALWLLGSDNAYQASYGSGPYPGWSAVDVAVGKDNLARVLWTNVDGRTALWSVDNSGHATYGPIYGPYSGWTARAVEAGGDCLTRVIWYNDANSVGVLWLMSPDNSLTASLPPGGIYGPYIPPEGSPWKMADLTVGADNQTRLLWTNPDGRMAVWSVDNLDNRVYGPIYGPYAGFIAGHIASSAEGLTYVLWNRADGLAALWLLGQSGSYNNVYETSYGFGPY